MARVQLRKAAKAYPAQGIEKGDQYYFAQIKTGPRSSRIIRSKSPIPRSQLTTSDFLSQLYSIEDNSFVGIDGPDGLREVAETIRELGQEQQEKYDNMSDGLQQGDTGVMIEERANGMESWADNIDSAADELETELTEFDEQIETARSEKAEYDNAMAEYDEDDPDSVEPDEPAYDLPDGVSIDEIDDEERIAEVRRELIDNRVQEAQDANPGVS
jgi:hypothetical protein